VDIPKEALQSIGEQLKTIRESKNISQKTVMIRTGIAQKTISRIENGIDSPRMSTVIKFAHAVGAELALVDVESEVS
jgi:transcriptional regulator with XRE-family HTH domain